MSFGKLSTVRFGHGQRHGLSENGVTWAALVSEQHRIHPDVVPGSFLTRQSRLTGDEATYSGESA
jgi:hypothetical protein